MKLSFLNETQTVCKDTIISDINSCETSWLKEFRLSALDQTSLQPFPNRKSEHWKYNDISFLRDRTLSIFTNDVNREELIQKFGLSIEELNVCLFVNGKYIANDSSAFFDKAIKVTPFSAADKSQQDLIADRFVNANQNRNIFIPLNSALSQDGVLIEIEKGKTIERPIYLLHINQQSSIDSIRSSQVVIECGNNSQCEIIEHFASQNELTRKTDESINLALQHSLINLNKNSHCKHSRLNLEDDDSSQISRLRISLDKNSSLKSFFYSQGSQLSKTDIDISHQGEHSESQLIGIYLPSDENTVDYHTNIEHRVAHCTSREIFRGIIADSAKATFSGKIHIFKDAQKSDAQLNNKNLLLTNQAEINTKPELEIYADDVICAHGATIAKIDQQAIYYLQSRGINEMTAKKMLSVGFINELLEKIENPQLLAILTQQVNACLADIK